MRHISTSLLLTAASKVAALLLRIALTRQWQLLLLLVMVQAPVQHLAQRLSKQYSTQQLQSSCLQVQHCSWHPAMQTTMQLCTRVLETQQAPILADQQQR
jgi:hypothetical protein